MYCPGCFPGLTGFSGDDVHLLPWGKASFLEGTRARPPPSLSPSHLWPAGFWLWEVVKGHRELTFPHRLTEWGAMEVGRPQGYRTATSRDHCQAQVFQAGQVQGSGEHSGLQGKGWGTVGHGAALHERLLFLPQEIFIIGFWFGEAGTHIEHPCTHIHTYTHTLFLDDWTVEFILKTFLGITEDFCTFKHSKKWSTPEHTGKSSQSQRFH